MSFPVCVWQPLKQHWWCPPLRGTVESPMKPSGPGAICSLSLFQLYNSGGPRLRRMEGWVGNWWKHTHMHYFILFYFIILFYYFIFILFYFIILFFHERPRDRGRDTGRGRSRLHAGSPMQDSIPVTLGSLPEPKADATTEPPRHPPHAEF